MSLETISDPTIVKIKKKKNFGESQIKMVNLRLIYVSSKDSEGIVTVCLWVREMHQAGEFRKTRDQVKPLCLEIVRSVYIAHSHQEMIFL